MTRSTPPPPGRIQRLLAGGLLPVLALLAAAGRMEMPDPGVSGSERAQR
jgi:hypothetical protein